MLSLSSIPQNLIQHCSKDKIPNSNLHSTSSNNKPQGLPPKLTYNNSISNNFPKERPRETIKTQATTRSRSKHNTYDQKITISKRAPNKHTDKMNTNKNTIATQTEDDTNKGLGRSASRPNPSDPIYPLSNATDMPQYRKNLCQVFGEEFLAEATEKH